MNQTLRQKVEIAVRRLDEVLPGQAPILNFVARNKLQNLEHMAFSDALVYMEKLTGIRGFPTEAEFRSFYAQGRIDEADLKHAFDECPELLADDILLELPGRSIKRSELYKISMLYGIEALSPNQLNWQIDEFQALHSFQEDVPKSVRMDFLNSIKRMGHEVNKETIQDLWNACLAVFALDCYRQHPEDLLDLSLIEAESIMDRFEVADPDSCQINPEIHCFMRQAVRLKLDELFASDFSLRSILFKLTGKDLLEEVRPQLVRFVASCMDEGIASWHLPNREQGLYAAWKACSFLNDQSLELPENSTDAVIVELQHLGIPEDCWEDALRAIALELPGWSGIVNWREQNPGYIKNQESPVILMDYLAIRLYLDRLCIKRVCQETWGISGDFNSLKNYFEHNLSEFMARIELFKGCLPEYLAVKVQGLLALSSTERIQHEQWTILADMIWIWQQSPVVENSGHHTVYGSVWRLFRLSQHLAIDADALRQCSLKEIERLLDLLDALNASKRAHCWLLAYENHYKQDLLNALDQNLKLGTQREARAKAQVMFCMDDREESIRRHLEEVNPQIETLGAAGFFGVAMNWKGLGDTKLTPLCPVVVTPAHVVCELAQAPEDECIRHEKRHRIKNWFSRLFNQEIRRNLFSSTLLIDFLSLGVLGVLTAKVFFPKQQAELSEKFSQSIVPQIATRISLNALDEQQKATAENPRLGFSLDEQVDRVANLLRMCGLVSNFAPLMVLMGHGSTSQNNPHFAAYDCGACSGRHGGPNARAFAAMANQSDVRLFLKDRGIFIPDDTWFIGAEHDTCSEKITWFDTDDIPSSFKSAFELLKYDLDEACRLSAHERCRRLASAPQKPSLEAALNHVIKRSVDFSQARPELGHATNASAVIGRRSITQGLFLDRRTFLISYDANLDPEGRIIENILLAAGPVGAGINLEYFFSRVNNDFYGSGSKVPQNVTGLFGVMEGTNSDLRHGLPRQMIEIHEPMRLQFIVEASTEILTQIYQRQKVLEQLIGNRWAYLTAIDPKTGSISVFKPGQGFQAWRGDARIFKRVEHSMDWYAGQSDPIKPAFIGKRVG